MEVLLLIFQIRYFRIDRDYCIGKLEHISKRIDKTIATNGDITASTCLEPAIAITTQQYSRTGSMVKQIVLHHRLFRSTE